MDLFWKQEEKWERIPYVQSFIRINLHKENGKLASSGMWEGEETCSDSNAAVKVMAVLLFHCLLLSPLTLTPNPNP